ncbi:MAG TPA: CoA transferase [Acidimicrobiales bacterium]|nr:CoA transferase [Acidimicrobiales bacterium]
MNPEEKPEQEAEQGTAAKAPGPEVLAGVRVIDVTTGPVGGMATMILADFGADVIKLEPPGGDRFRSLPSAHMWLRGKRSFTADLSTTAGISDLHSFVTSADVLVVGGPPSRARSWGIDAEGAIELRPGLVHCSITGWGPAGPLAEVPGYEGAVAARGGRMLAFQRQLRRGGPVFAAVPVAGHVAALGAVQGILAGLIARARGGGAQRVETSLLQGLLPFDLTELLLVEMAERHGVVAPNLSAAGGDLPTLNYHPVLASDGRWIQCGNLLEHLLYSFLDATDLLGEMLQEPRFSGPPSTWDEEAVEAARDMILLRLQERTADEWMAVFRANGNVAAEPFLTTAQALDHPDVVANGDVVDVDDPEVGTVRTVGSIAELSRTPARIGPGGPHPGRHTDEILREIRGARSDDGWLPDQDPEARGALGEGGGPLHGITVVEFATIIAAPLATSMLADLGAKVIKVEPPGGDPYRHLVEGGTPAAKTTAGKSSICLDLKSDDGRRIARELARGADVVVHNARPGAAERMGLGEQDLRAENPGLIWVSLTGYGLHGPSSHRPSTHPCAGAATGGPAFQAGAALRQRCETLADVREISRQLIRANDSSPDPNTAVVAAASILMALLARERYGFGQAVHVNMLAANLYANSDDALRYQGKPERVTSDDDLFGPSAGYRLYPCADGWLFLAVTTDAEWRTCMDILGLAQPGGPEQVAHALRSRPAAEWEERFVRAGIAGVRADTATPGNFFAHDPQMIANDFSPECTHARFGAHRRWGPIVRVNGGLDSYGPGVLAGQQTDRILADLGYGPAEIQDLRSRRVVTSEPTAG